jgi:threonylcarbamoyladenosine tRNA methylthiotransferase MtaB
MPHLHLSLQAGDDMILKRMKRRHLRDDAIAFFCEEARRLRPSITFGADIIAGFPTETDCHVRKLAQARGRLRAHLAPYLSLQPTPRNTRRQDATGGRAK